MTKRRVLPHPGPTRAFHLVDERSRFRGEAWVASLCGDEVGERFFPPAHAAGEVADPLGEVPQRPVFPVAARVVAITGAQLVRLSDVRAPPSDHLGDHRRTAPLWSQHHDRPHQHRRQPHTVGERPRQQFGGPSDGSARLSVATYPSHRGPPVRRIGRRWCFQCLPRPRQAGRESLWTNADDRLPLASLGRVEGRNGIVEGRDVVDVRPQPSVTHPPDDLTQLGAIGLDDEVDR
jgi:hypothetical protein